MEADETFCTHPSPILHNDERLGYIYDARREIPGWCEPDFDDSEWDNAKQCLSPRGERVICEADPIKIRQRIEPVSLAYFDELPYAYDGTLENAKPIASTVRKHVYVYDFGVNTAGVTELHIHGKPGQIITVRHGEWNQKGRFSVSTTMFFREGLVQPYLDYNQTDIFILKGGEETLVPRFKYDGFRYAYVEGLEPEQATKDALTYLEMSSDLGERGSFASSDESLNRLFDMTDRADRSNFVWFPTDCPHREKNGWTGDASMSAEHMLMHMKAETSLRVWLRSIRAAQRIDGALPGIVPTGGWGFEWGNGPAWDSVAFNLPFEIYRTTGDRDVIKENASMMLRYLSYVITRRDERGLVAIGLGDWVDPFEYYGHGTTIASPLVVTDSVMLYDIAKKAAHLFGQIGYTKEVDLISGLKLIPNFGGNNQFNLSLSIRALDQKDRTEILATPRLLVIAGYPGKLTIAEERYFPDSWTDAEIEIVNGTSYTYTAPTPEFGDATNVGTIFTVKPTVSSNNYTILLNIDTDISRMTGWSNYDYSIVIGSMLYSPGNTSSTNFTPKMKMPEFSKRKLKSTVKIYDGETVVIGGILEDIVSRREDHR